MYAYAISHTVWMIEIIGLLRAVLIDTGRERPKNATTEYAEQLKREVLERKKHIEELVARYERDNAIRRVNRD